MKRRGVRTALWRAFRGEDDVVQGAFPSILAEKVCDPQSDLVIDVEACWEPCAYLVLNAELKY